MLKYTICFIRQSNSLLMLNREKPFGMGSWNGVGGKLRSSETPRECILREVYEETGIELSDAMFAGIVTWEVNGNFVDGMYVFVAEIPLDFRYETPRKTVEGILDWKGIDWILNPENTGVIPNIPKFLPKILEDNEPYEHRCIYRDNILRAVDMISLRLPLS